MNIFKGLDVSSDRLEIEINQKSVCKIEGMFKNGLLNPEFFNRNYRSFHGWKCKVAIPMMDDWDESSEQLISIAENHFTFISGFHYRTETPEDHIYITQFDVDSIPEGEWVWKRMRTRGDWNLVQWKTPKTDIRHYMKRNHVVPLILAEDEREAEYLNEWCVYE